MTHAGIDYGAKNAGTTVCCFERNGRLEFHQTKKKQDADRFLSELIRELSPENVFIDAPLSLPMVYKGEYHDHQSDFHYRKCDRETGAMSPMFLGGLTARAIKLSAEWRNMNIAVHETYPSRLISVLSMSQYYKSDLEKFCSEAALISEPEIPRLENWHQADALLAWLSGVRFLNNTFIQFGDPSEGLIIV